MDLVAETFAVVVQDRRRFRGEGDDAAIGWIYGIARNLLRRWYRDGAIERRAMTRIGIDRPAVTVAEAERLAELADLAGARGLVAAELGSLPNDQRVAVQLRVVEGLSYEDAARTMGVSLDAARARVSRGLRAMEATLASHPEFAQRGVGRV